MTYPAPTFDLPVNYRKLSSRDRGRVRRQYVTQQEGKCWHCGALLVHDPRGDIKRLWINKQLFPKGFLDHPIHLQHSHKTGMTEGAVHAHCNAVLWQYQKR